MWAMNSTNFEVIRLRKDAPDFGNVVEDIKGQIQRDEIKVLDVTRSSPNELIIVFKRRIRSL